MEINNPVKIIMQADRDIENWYLQPVVMGGLVNINIFKKENDKMVDLEKIKKDIEDLQNLNAEEYCKPQVEQLYADFEKSREQKIAELENALVIFEQYQIVEEPVADDIDVAENADNLEAY